MVKGDFGMEHKIRVSIGHLEVELTGSEDFIKKYEEKFQLATKVQQLSNEESLKNALAETVQSQNIQQNNLQRSNQYEYVFDLSSEKTQLILSKMPGKNKAEKQVSTALLYIFGETTLRSENKETVPIEEIREQCEFHGCLDINLSTYLKRKRQWFTIEGKKGSRGRQIRLTRPGESEAQRLAEELNNGQSASNT